MTFHSFIELRGKNKANKYIAGKKLKERKPSTRKKASDAVDIQYRHFAASQMF